MRPRDAAAPERARLVQRDEKTRLVQNGARSKRLTRASLAPAAVVGLYIISSAGNALMFKRMTDVYEGSEFFASQWNVLLYDGRGVNQSRPVRGRAGGGAAAAARRGYSAGGESRRRRGRETRMFRGRRAS